ncbi:major facilitator superfamily domain-containing protein [Xylariales sp. PMI_506]|nr:major facilitator superfamily domain-containing protein [Xylariales sp. PMI_506]
MATQTITELQTLEPAASGVDPYYLTASRKSHESISVPAAAPAAGLLAATKEATTAAEAGATGASPAVVVVESRLRTALIIIQLLGSTLFNSFCNGTVVVGLPAMAASLDLPESLLVWPTSVFYLTAGSCLMMAGSVADVVGTRRVNLVGCLLAAAFTLGCGLARTGGELIAFRALQGVSNAIVVPSSISIISTNLEEGRPRNMGFACLGFAAPIGFSLGLVLGGVFVDALSWRAGFYLAGAATFALFLLGIWALPADAPSRSGRPVWERIAKEIDWVGAILASAGLAALSYVLAALSSDTSSIGQASNIALLVISAASVPAFVWWMHHQEKHSRSTLIPNSLWRSSVFTSSCIMVLFTTAVCNCMELFSSLFFQEVQGQTALGASIRILPSLIAGALTNLSTGIFVNRMPVMWAVLISSAVSAVAPLLMALIKPEWPYWVDAFFAQILAPLSCDILFTVGLLIVSDVFPAHMQAVSGAVFNTCAQLGTAIGLSVTSVITSSVTNASHYADKSSPDAVMEGYRAVFWTMFGWSVLVCVVCVLGLRRVGGIGLKRD